MAGDRQLRYEVILDAKGGVLSVREFTGALDKGAKEGAASAKKLGQALGDVAAIAKKAAKEQETATAKKAKEEEAFAKKRVDLERQLARELKQIGMTETQRKAHELRRQYAEYKKTVDNEALLEKWLTGQKKRLADEAAAAQKKPLDALGLLKGAIAGIGFAYVSSKAIEFGKAAVAAFRDVQDAAFALEKAAGGGYGRMVEEARKLSAETRNLFRVDEIENATSRGIKAMEKYGLSHDQTMQLIRRGAGAAAARNIGLGDATERLFAAMRGEAESAEALGLTLGDSYMKNQAFNGSLKNTWEKLTDAEKAAYRYKEMLQQTAHWTTTATDKGQTLSGATRMLQNDWHDLMAKLVSGVGDSQTVTGGIAGIGGAVQELTAGISENKDEIAAFFGMLANAAGGAILLAKNMAGLETNAQKSADAWMVAQRNLAGAREKYDASVSSGDARAQNFLAAQVRMYEADIKRQVDALHKTITAAPKVQGGQTGASSPAVTPPISTGPDQKVIDARRRTFAELQKLTMEQVAYEKWAVEQEYKDRKKVEGDTVTLRQWKTAQMEALDKKAVEKTKKEEKTLHDWILKSDTDETSRKEQALIDEYDLMVEQYGDREDLYQAYVDRLGQLHKEDEEKRTRTTEEENRKRAAEYQKFTSTFGGLMSGMGGQTSEFWSAFATLGEDAFTGIAASFGVTTEEMTGYVSGVAGVYSAGMAGQQQTAQGNRTGGIIAGAMGGAAAGAQMGAYSSNPYGVAIGAVVGAVAGGALASSAPDPDTGAFGEHGLGQRAQLRDNALGAESRFAPLFSEALATKRGDVAAYISRQMGEIMRDVMDLSDLLPQHVRDWDVLGNSMEYVGGTIDQYGLNSEQARGAMQMVSDQASTLALDMLLTGQANSATTKTAVDLAVALNQEGAQVLATTTAMQSMYQQLSAIDDRTRGLTQASQSLSLAETMLAGGTMLSVEQFTRLNQIHHDLSGIESRRVQIMRDLNDTTDPEKVAALYAELQNLNEGAKPLEEELTKLGGAAEGMGAGSEQSATDLNKVNSATDDLGKGANELVGKLDKTAGGLDRTATFAGAAERKIRDLRDTIDTLHDKTVTLTFDSEESSADGSHASGLGYVPFDGYLAELHRGERVLTADESRFYRMMERSMGPGYLQEVASLPSAPTPARSAAPAGTPLTVRVETPLVLDGREIARSVREVSVADSRNGVPWTRQEP
jgi:hypothetical protein